MSHSRLRLTPWVAASLAVTAIPLTAAAAAAAASPAAAPAATTATRTVTLEVAGLSRTSVPAARSLTAGQRAGLATALRPATGAVTAAATDARRAGLTVTATNGWSVTARGPASVVDAAVGPDAAAPVVPAGWRSVVSSVIDSSQGAGSFRAAGLQTVGALTAAYGSGAPSANVPALSASTPVVASLQLSGWDAGDLSDYAPTVFNDPGYDPVASGQYVAVAAGRSPAYASADGAGYSEVDLDQETLLAAAPQLKQRAYFAVNSSAGYLAGLQAVYNDAAAGVPIVALTTSWGGCETTSSAASRNAVDAVVNRLAALGVTTLAASGDSGIYDCTNRSGAAVQGVDFPASDPHVVAVGATTHDNGAASPAPDTVWSQPGTTSSFGRGGPVTSDSGSGGGESVAFARPSYQDSATASSGRAVPDLAVDGDPVTGVRIVTTNPATGATTTAQSGGTSLAAPLTAAMIAVSAARHPVASGATVGYGDVHAALYAHPEAFTDVVSVTSAFGEYDDGSVAPPAAGYDESSGLGTPRIDVLDALLSASRPATVIAAATSAQGPQVSVTSFARPVSTSNTARLSWTVRAGSAPVQGIAVTVTDGGKTLLSKTYPASTRSVSLTLPAGTSAASITVGSALGTSTAHAGLVTPSDDRSLTARRGWTATRDRSAYLGTLSTSSQVGRVAALTATGRTIRVTMRDGSSGGLAAVRVDSKVVKTIDTYASATHENVTTLITVPRSQRHSVTVTVLGRHSTRSHGSTVALDAVSIA